MAKQTYIKGDSVLVRNGDPKTGVYEDTVTKYDYSGYINDYGIDYRELSNYVLNDETITSATLVSKENGVYTFRYEINLENGVTGYRVNMYKMGDLSELPTMVKCTLEVEMDADFMPISISHFDEYTVNYFITITCNSSLKATFSKINDNTVTIPDEDFFGIGKLS